MIILPKIFYIFRTLLISIPKHIFNQIYKQINHYVWQNKKTRLSLSLMNKHLRMGILGLPNLQAYYFAVTLDQIKY